ncbi:saposin precursor, partial [Aphelenchoides avenae]
MARLFLIAFVSIALSVISARIDSEHDTNRTPKKPVLLFHSVCDECQDVVSRFRDVAEDPEKLAKAKTVLAGLCEQTSMVEECKVFANKLDLFTAKLLKYLVRHYFKRSLNDPRAYRRTLRLCARSSRCAVTLGWTSSIVWDSSTRRSTLMPWMERWTSAARSVSSRPTSWPAFSRRRHSGAKCVPFSPTICAPKLERISRP